MTDIKKAIKALTAALEIGMYKPGPGQDVQIGVRNLLSKLGIKEAGRQIPTLGTALQIENLSDALKYATFELNK